MRRRSHRQENLLAVFDRKHVVDRPGRNAAWHRRRGVAGHGVLHHVLGDEEHIVLEQCALHFLAAARAFALGKRRHCADGAEHSAHDVVDARAGAQRSAVRSRHVGHPPIICTTSSSAVR